MHDIFISYAKVDSEIAGSIAEALNKEGFEVWWDVNIPTGSSFDSAIEKALADAKCVIVLWSENSNISEWVHAEAAEGQARNILVPILISDTIIPLAFRRRQTADLRAWLRDKNDPSFDRVLADIRRICNPLKKTKDDKTEIQKIIQPNPVLVSGQEQADNTAHKSATKNYLKIFGVFSLLAVLAFALNYFIGDKSIKIGDSYEGGIIFQIAPDGSTLKVCGMNDLGSYNWYEAQDLAETYEGGGHSDWLLPTREELNMMYNNLSNEGLGNFKEDWYWSSTVTNGQAWEQQFPEGYQQNNGGGNESLSSVRLIRHITVNRKKVGDLHAGGIIFQIDSMGKHGKVVSLQDLGFFNWYEAKIQCENYNNDDYSDWYLPSRNDLQIIYDQLYPLNISAYPSNVSPFIEDWYWSASTTDEAAWEIHFSDGFWQNDGGGNNSNSIVRAIRDF